MNNVLALHQLGGGEVGLLECQSNISCDSGASCQSDISCDSNASRTHEALD